MSPCPLQKQACLGWRCGSSGKQQARAPVYRQAQQPQQSCSVQSISCFCVQQPLLHVLFQEDRTIAGSFAGSAIVSNTLMSPGPDSMYVKCFMAHVGVPEEDLLS